MNLTKFGLICLMLPMTVSLFSQSNAALERPFEVGLMPLKVEWSSETLYFVGGLKKPIGFYLNHRMRENGLDWTASLSFSETNILDACKGWCEGPFGNFDLTEAAITSGFGYTFLQYKKFPIKPYAQMEAHYTYVNYAGGLVSPSWEPFQITEQNIHFHMLGTITKVGAKAILFNRLSLSVLSGFRWGMGFFMNQFTAPRSGFHLGYAVSAVEVRCGVRF